MQTIKIASPNFNREFAEVKLLCQRFPEDRIEKDLSDQMRILEFAIPIDEEETRMILPSTTWGSLITVTHYLKISLKMPFGTTKVNLPFALYDHTVESDSLTFEELIGSLPHLIGFPFLSEVQNSFAAVRSLDSPKVSRF